MSAGVSDQRMKGQGNQQVINSTSKNVETEQRVIPWSQQVDDAPPYEPLPSPTEGSQSGCYESSSGGGTQFQYPPFKVKEVAAWSAGAGNSNKSARRLSSSNDNNDNDGYGQSFGQQSSYNYFPKNGDYNNSWSSQHPTQQQPQMNNSSHQQNRKSNNYDEHYRSDRSNYQNDNVKSVQRGMQNLGIDSGNDNRSANTSVARAKSTGQTATAPKQMTWASIASQPAKQPLRTSSTSSTLKKKGPGMPPPPMVPGKHNMDIGTWDSPKNAPVLVPPPPPPVIPVPIMEPNPINQNKNNPGLSNNGPPPSHASSGQSTNNAPPNKQQGSNNQPHRNYNQNASSVSSNNNNNINMRPSWADQRDPPHIVKSLRASQNQRPSMNEERNNSTMRQSSRDDYHGRQPVQQQQHHQQKQQRPQSTSPLPPAQISHPPAAPSPTLSNSSSNYPVLDELRDRNTYNPQEIDLENATNARFFVIKSYSEDDIHRSIKYAIWCSTEHGNKRLDQAYRERESVNGIVYLFFSVNGSGHFCGMAQMMTPVDYNSVSNVWSQAKWKGTFKVKWIYVKDVPNNQLRHIHLENNENKSVTNSRDTQEVPNAKGIQVLKVLHVYKHITSIFDDFFHYEKLQEEEDSKKYEPPALQGQDHFEGPPNMSPPSKSHRGGSGDYERGYDKGYHSSGGGSGGGGSGGAGGGYREKSYGRGGYHNYENRRPHDDHRGGGGYDRERFQRDGGGRDNEERGGRSNHYNNIRENSSGGDYNNRGFHRNEFRRDDRGHSGGFNNRDRERDREGSDRDNYDGGFITRGGDSGGGGRSSGGFRGEHFRDRGDHNSRGRGRGGLGHRN